MKVNFSQSIVKVGILFLTISLTACGTLKNEYTVNNQDMREKDASSQLVTSIVLIALAAGVSNAINKSNGGCQHYSDRAKDGSLCGLRSADSRPGGR
jgi:hypothetical protein